MHEFPVLRTPRLLLRGLSHKDLDTIFFLRSDQGVNRFIKRELARSVSDAREWLTRITLAVQERKSVNWAITLTGEDKMLGSICLWNFSPDRKTVELGYDLLPQFQGQGLMSEAVQAVLDFGQNSRSLEVVEAFTHRQNQQSKKLLMKHGFSHDPSRTDKDNADNLIFIRQLNVKAD